MTAVNGRALDAIEFDTAHLARDMAAAVGLLTQLVGLTEDLVAAVDALTAIADDHVDAGSRHAPCKDCGRQTIPDDDHWQELGGHEFYMVNDDVWKAAGDVEGFLCIACLEERLGRRLTPADFNGAPCNGPSSCDSPLLRDRKGHA